MKRWIVAVALTIVAGVVWFGVGEAQDPAAAQMKKVEEAQSPNRQGFDAYTMAGMMKWFHVPGVSIAVVRDFQVQSTKTYGVADVLTNAPVTGETRFQAASIVNR